MFLRAFAVAIAAVVVVSAVSEAGAQERYTYTTTRTIPINWRPDSTRLQRYTVAVRPLMLINHGLKFDFEYELPRAGYWIQTSLAAYVAPARNERRRYGWNDYDGNNRHDFLSAFDDYHRMWGLGTSVLFKNTFGRRGWYFSTGLVLEYFRVGVMSGTFLPYMEDGLTFYERGRKLEAKSYFKPTAQINIGKHMALSRRCFFDFYVGLGLSYSLFKDDDRHTYDGYDWRYPLFDEMGGFACRGIEPQGGFRIGVLLWESNGDGRVKYRR